MKILAFETSCDETACAVLDDEKPAWVLSSIVASQDDLHAQYGGVIPELASRRHIEVLPQVVAEALKRSGLALTDLDAIAVTHTPGLMGALLVGLSYAKGLALATGLPLLGVNHLAGHLASVLLDGSTLAWPHLGFVVSGGHTGLYLGEAKGGYRLLGSTRDDAAGEAFDKVAKLLGLGYPGGREIEKCARLFALDKNPSLILNKLPRLRLKDGLYGFSFSGLKTAVAQFIHTNSGYDRNELCFAFQERVFEILSEQVVRAAQEFRPRALIFCGGVAANKRLREGLFALCRQHNMEFKVPDFLWCTDNAAMIGAAGLLKLKHGFIDDLTLTATPTMLHDTQALLRDFFPGGSET